MATLSLSQVKNKQAQEVARLSDELQAAQQEILNHQRNEESLREQLEDLKAMDPVRLQRELKAALEQLEAMEIKQQQFQIERMEAFMTVESEASKKQDELKAMAQELRAVKTELKNLKELNPERLRQRVDEQKKKLAAKTGENKKLVAEVNNLRTKLRELKNEQKDEAAEAEAKTEVVEQAS